MARRESYKLPKKKIKPKKIFSMGSRYPVNNVGMPGLKL